MYVLSIFDLDYTVVKLFYFFYSHIFLPLCGSVVVVVARLWLTYYLALIHYHFFGFAFALYTIPLATCSIQNSKSRIEFLLFTLVGESLLCLPCKISNSFFVRRHHHHQSFLLDLFPHFKYFLGEHAYLVIIQFPQKFYTSFFFKCNFS